MLRIKILSIIILSFVSFTNVSARQHSISSIPDPKKQGQDYFVSNPDGILSSSEVAELNQIAKQIEATGKVEFAIVVINDFTQEDDDFTFAYALFNAWGIGKKDADNGLLLLVAKDRRRYRFITGSGIEGLLPDIRLKQIGERVLVPAFKQGNYGEGIVNAASVIEKTLGSPDGIAELNTLIPREKTFVEKNVDHLLAALATILAYFGLFKLFKRFKTNAQTSAKKKNDGLEKNILVGCGIIFFGIFFGVFAANLFRINIIEPKNLPWTIAAVASLFLTMQINIRRRAIKKEHTDVSSYLAAVKGYLAKTALLVPFAPLTVIGILKQYFKNRSLSKQLVAPEGFEHYQRIDRSTNKDGKPFLTSGQIKEERLEAKTYQIWKGSKADEVQIVAWPGEKSANFSECEKCHFSTMTQPKLKTITQATYSSAGKAERYQSCEFCNNRVSLGLVVLAKLVRTTSSGSSSSSSSSSSSGSWGGGRSSGGGAGGSW